MKPAAPLFIVLFSTSLVTSSFAQEKVQDTFLCSFNDGKGMDDLLSARAFYVEQASKAGIQARNAYLWTPFKGQFDFDFAWLEYHDSLPAFTEATDAMAASSEIAAAKARLGEVASCHSDIHFFYPIFEGTEPPVAAPRVFIDSYACQLLPGKTVADAEALFKHINRISQNFPGHKDAYLYATIPMTSGPGSADVYITGVHATASRWLAHESEVLSSEAAPALRENFEAVLDCAMGMFYGQPLKDAP